MPDISHTRDDDWEDAPTAVVDAESWVTPPAAEHDTREAETARLPQQRVRYRGIRLTYEDLVVMEMLLRVRAATYDQIARCTGRTISALRNRLPRLEGQGYLISRQVFHGRGKIWWVTRQGATLLGLGLPAESLKLGTLAHTLALTDLFISFSNSAETAVNGGRIVNLTTERELRAAHRHKVAALGKAFEREPIPDLTIEFETPTGEFPTIAVELQRSRVSNTNALQRKLHAYLHCPEYQYVLYYCIGDAVEKQIRAAVNAVSGPAGIIEVRSFRPTDLAATPP